MSTRREDVADVVEAARPVVDIFAAHYHVPALGLLVGFMLWVRLQAYDRFLRGGEVFFSGNDAWYHLRQVEYVVANWPATMPFDPWTFFPHGTTVGQFGTLYDQLVATAALVVGLGDPSSRTVALTLLVAPAVFGALVAVPVYLVGRRLGGRFGGLFGVVVLALIPGSFLRRGLVGFADHNIAEPLFQTFALLAVMVALTVAERDKPVYELLLDRDVEGLRRTVAWSALAGAAVALYMWIWPPGVLLVGIVGVFFAVKLTLDYAHGDTPEPLAFVGVVSMSVAALLMLVPMQTLRPTPTLFSGLQPLLALLVAAGCGFLAWLARAWDARDLSRSLYPATVGGLLLAGVALVRFATPGLFGLVRRNVVRVVAFGQGAETRTIAEAQPIPFDQIIPFATSQYGWAFYTAWVAIALMALLWYVSDDVPSEELLVVVWAVFITAAAFTQIRFNYYLAVVVAVLNAFLMGEIIRWLGVGDARTALGELEGYQIMVVLAVVVLVVAPLAPPLADATVVSQGKQGVGPGAVTQWDGALQWMQHNTPREGTFGGAGDPMDYGATYGAEDGDFDYWPGTYGVMSWWDYGHWITVRGRRIPNANPFQQGATEAANFLLAPNESAADARLSALSDGEAKSRYVLVDWKMVYPGDKFSAPTVFYDKRPVNTSTYYEPVYTAQQPIRVQFYLHEQAYYEAMMIRLYQFHGSAAEPSPFVVNYDRAQFQDNEGNRFTAKTMPSQGQPVRAFRTMRQARQFVNQDGTARIGGFGPYPTERVPALEHYRLVAVSDAQAPQRLRPLWDPVPAWTKVFERVPGARVTGSGPPNTTVTARVELRVPNANATFNYTQQARTGPEGDFEMRLPYSTTGYDEWGPDNGYTNVSVRATGPYEFSTPRRFENDSIVFANATAHVGEAKVIGEDADPLSVALQEQSFEFNLNQSLTTNGTDNGSLVGGPPVPDRAAPPGTDDAGDPARGPAALDNRVGGTVPLAARPRSPA